MNDVASQCDFDKETVLKAMAECESLLHRQAEQQNNQQAMLQEIMRRSFQEGVQHGMTSLQSELHKVNKKVGSGAFGEIYEVIQNDTCQRFAAKVELATRKKPMLLNEFKVM